MPIMHWVEVCYVTPDYESELLQIKTSTFPWVQFFKKKQKNIVIFYTIAT